MAATPPILGRVLLDHYNCRAQGVERAELTCKRKLDFSVPDLPGFPTSAKRQVGVYLGSIAMRQMSTALRLEDARRHSLCRFRRAFDRQ
jgi:hypothetical protein